MYNPKVQVCASKDAIQKYCLAQKIQLQYLG